MRSVTRTPARSVLVSGRVATAGAAGVLTLVLGLSGCDSGDDIEGNQDGATSDRGTDAPDVTTVVTLQNVGQDLDADHRARVKDGVTAAIDPWLEGAFLGDFPRGGYTDAFAGFTPGAAQDAERDLDLLSNQVIGDQIETATATKRRVRLDLFAPDGHPRGATAHVVLDFTTVGDLEESMRVRGDLYLAKDKGEWKIFGYDVGQAEQL
jgi:hypothetical protein